MRDANLPHKARDLIEMWSGEEYDYEKMQRYAKVLERPIPGNRGQRITGLTALMDEVGPDKSETLATITSGAADSTCVFMQDSLFVMPEAFGDLLLDEVMRDLHNPEVVNVAGDLAEDVILDEDEAVAILANYGQVPQYLHNGLEPRFLPEQTARWRKEAT